MPILTHSWRLDEHEIRIAVILNALRPDTVRSNTSEWLARIDEPRQQLAPSETALLAKALAHWQEER